DFQKAKAYYQNSIMFAEMSNERESGYFVNSYLNLARIAKQERELKTAKQYYTIVLEATDKKNAANKEAKNFIKAHRKI
ncbi:MAG: tol-pal system protein YbgF, partial [Hymenobacteraceae bacterium]|nr:tol-pal system protein YbgF [Hymenobacteraceae bacterium]